MKPLHDRPGETASASASLNRLFELAEVLGALMERGVAERGLTRARAGLLWALLHHGPMTQRALAAHLRVTPRNVTGLLDALQADGLVAREPHPDDRRATLVTLTEPGRTLTAGLQAGRDELATHLFGDIPTAQLTAIQDGLETVIARLRATDEASRRE
ncbi:MarR family transcriptional regulator [Streptomyces sp. WAC 00631]|uniref:MarR family winged helix-turn-helix transcriptional regulator n=1 Tax=unclassified Streptomyces TaxID=2593676 RepID=UPI001C8BBCC2|nr:MULTISPECIES: MarR family transcriptional regulator [unclassified Streptomyces]MCC5032208.1 MarR family transcriptional regulator [Streptomyces sp. WAC 00631]MCC9740318.1 MarR family transcriptional regulator [Streptomyces sp. MNU89]